jgi:hypothetical protein
MSEHVLIRPLEWMAGDESRPLLRAGMETRDRAGPAFKHGVYSDDVVWIQLSGGLMVAKARVKESWRGEYSKIDELRRRLSDVPLGEIIWQGRPRAGYAVIARLDQERWIEPAWQGPRSYGYEWVTLENDSKVKSWLEEKDPPRGGEDLAQRFTAARAKGFPTVAPA